MGAASSRVVERVIGAGDEAAPAAATRTWGLENFGNTCYANSVLQALYACGPFRERALVYHAERAAAKADADEHLLAALAELFASIASQRKKVGSLAPKRFVQRLKQDNELFRSFQHQDAHEFLNFLLNSCCDILEKEERAKLPRTAPVRTWVHDVFQGVLTNQTRCMWCEAVTNREESYLDLSLDIGRNSSVGACLRGFSAVETLAGADKFHCDACGGLQEAQKRLLIRSAPAVLALHLKRFKYAEALGMHTKLTHRVAFPARLRLGAAACVEPGSPDADAEYTLFAVVVHVGSGPHHGHYIAFTKAAPTPPPPPPSPAAAALSAAAAAAAAAAMPPAAPLAPELVAATASSAPAPAAGRAWVQFDDDGVEVVDEAVLARLYGSDAPPTPLPEGAAAAAAAASDDSASERGDGDDVFEAAGPAAGAAAAAAAGGDAEMADAASQPHASPGAFGAGGLGGLGPPSTEHGYILFYERVPPQAKAAS